MEDKLNDDWINDFDKIDNLYQHFYKDDLYFMNLKFIYINRNNLIERIKEEPFLMSKPNFISREEILKILKDSLVNNNKQYTLLSILKYNFILDTEDIKLFLLSKQEINYLTIVKNIDAITFEKTISMFQDLNELIFIFYEKSNELKKKDPNNSTKKVYLNSFTNCRKTIKKRYKD
jgi:hypothetical protein